MSGKLKIIGFLLMLISSVLLFTQTQKQASFDNVSFKTIQGEMFDLQSLYGKPALISFWSTDCPSCIEEIPHLIELHNEFAAQGFKIIAVAMDYTPPNQVVAMADARNLPYTLVLDPESVIAKHFGDIRLTPTSFLLSPSGAIEKHILGPFNIQEIKTLVAQWLRDSH